MHKNVAIKVERLTKTYKLYSQPIDRLKESLHPLKKKYHQVFGAVNELSFEIKKGETVGIIGRNGSGKSTLLKMITGVLTPTSGRVIVHGKISAILELGAGFNPEMTGLENIYLNTAINGLSKENTDKKIGEIIAFAELNEFIHQPIKTYSSGMKARLAFAVSINVDPDILIVDEALSVGDAAFQRKCFAKMEEIRKNGATILFVSHSEGSIVELCNRAIWLSHGEKVLDGTPKFVTGLYLKYLDAPQLNHSIVLNEYTQLEYSNDTKTNRPSNQATNSNNKKEEFYSTSLLPKSTVYYDEKGAKIYDVKVTTLDGEKVNILVHGNEYLFTYKVEFYEQQNDVQFGMLIKTKEGINLGGGIYPDRAHYISHISSDQEVTFKFKCLFTEGDYFFNAGVTAKKSTSIEYIHRVLDAYMIKVIQSKKTFTSMINFIDNAFVKEVK